MEDGVIMNKNLIYKEDAINVIYEAFCYAYCDNCEKDMNEDLCDDCHRKYQNWSASKTTITNALNKLDVIEQPTGHWELAEDGWYCTNCELYPPFDCDPEEKGIPFCPWCGAKMKI